MVTSPLAPPNISANAAATGTDMPSSASITKAHSRRRQREAHHPQRMQVAAEGEFDQPRADLRRPEQRADPDHRSGIDAGAREDRQQMRGQAGGNEGIGRERRGHQNERQSMRRQHRPAPAVRRCAAACPLRSGRAAAPRHAAARRCRPAARHRPDRCRASRPPRAGNASPASSRSRRSRRPASAR